MFNMAPHGKELSEDLRISANDTSYHVPNNSFQLQMDLAGIIYFYNQSSFYWVHKLVVFLHLFSFYAA